MREEFNKTDSMKIINIGEYYFLLSDEKIMEGDHFVGFEHGTARLRGRGWFRTFHDGSNRSKVSSIAVGSSKFIATDLNIDGLHKLDRYHLDKIIEKNNIQKQSIGFAEFLNENRWYNFDKKTQKWCYTFEMGTSMDKKSYVINHMKTSEELFKIYQKDIADKVWRVDVALKNDSNELALDHFERLIIKRLSK